MATGRYVPVAPNRTRVTLTRELPSRSWGPTVRFLAEISGTPVSVEVYEGVDIIRIRQAIADEGAAIYDSPTYRIDLATPAEAALGRPRDLGGLQERVQSGSVGGPRDGAA